MLLTALFSLVFPSLTLAAPTEGSRLISLREGHREWMTESQIIERVYKPKLHFVDVTEGEWDSIAALVPQAAPSYPSAVSHQSLVQSLIAGIDKTAIKSFLDTFSSFNNRYYTSTTGAKSAQFLFDELVKIKTANTRTDISITVTKFNHTWTQPSIIATLRARNSASDDRIILGAHQDSINGNDPTNGRAPGYDDDGTGTANNLFALKLLSAASDFVPGRPIEFHFYSGEEAGLKGSQKVAAKYVSDAVSVYAMLQSDMTGYPSKNPAYAVMTDYTTPSLSSFLRLVAKTYTALPVVDTKCGYGCSDHASWNKAGFPTAFHFETIMNSDNPKIHTAGDTFSEISLDHAVEFLKSTLGFGVELSLFKQL
ncbi:Leucine aminopeptidase 1 [Kappamyces sp. JEL0680]|nr:Leucine aminopeptidase 1 [Kappamyces sp. JEL0680]